MQNRGSGFTALIVAFAFSSTTVGGQSASRALLDEIRTIRAIDNHSHILSAAPQVGSALPADLAGSPPFLYPVRLRVDNPEWMRVWNTLYGVRVNELDAAHRRRVYDRKLELRREQGDRWPAWVLDKTHIEIALVNLPSLGAGQDSSHFRWVPNANSLLYPFGGIDRDPEAGEPGRPRSLYAYVNDVIAGTLKSWRGRGAVAIKISLAYSRPLDFADVSRERAAAVYARYTAEGGAPPAAEYKELQDYLFRALAREAGRVGLVVHIHTGIGADPYFAIAGGSPLLLERALNDESLRATQFVLIHGGWPFDRQAGAMLIKPNVYADFSAQTFLRSPRALSETLRAWLEWYPEKVLFGSDAYSDSNTPMSDWEEMLCLSNDSAREALAIALTGMIDDGEITIARAMQLARMVLRENALKLYGLNAERQGG
jgi:uncharacterized protein